MVDLDLLRAVVAVWRVGSVTGAAKQLHLTQGAVSARLKAAEAEVGRTLFVRRPRGVEPTEVCDRLVRAVLGPLDAVESAWTDALARDETDVTVHLGGPSDFLAELVLPALVGGHRVAASFGLPDELLSAVYDGRLDLAVSTVAPRRSPAVVEAIFEEKLLWVGHAKAWSDGPWLAYGEGLPLISRYAKHTRRPKPTPDVVVADLRALARMLETGAGTTVLPHYLVPKNIPVIEQLDPPVTNTLWLVTSRGRAGFASVRAVTEALRRHLDAL
ncbi:MAG: LysR family transcriptional regulator [Myxococcota bacterium]